MGREQSEKLNTSPSRGSGYQVINDLFDRQQDFIVVGLCGKTGSGVSTTAEILNKEFEELHLNAEPPAAGTDYERHEYRLLYNYARRNWNCFYLVKTRALITARVLGKTADAFTQFLCELVNADKCNNEEESKNIIKLIVENQLYNAAMTFEINTQFKLKEKGLPNTGIEAEKFFGIGENPLDDYDAILLNPKAEREQRPIVDLTSLQGNNCEVKLPGAEEDGEPTAIHIHVEDAASGRISITNHDLYSLFHYYQRSRERKKGNINSLYYWILEEYIYHFLPEQTKKFWEKMSEEVPDFDKKETVAMQLLGNNLRISNEPLDKDQDGKYYNLKEDAYVLQDSVIAMLADALVENQKRENTHLPALQEELKRVNKKIDNIAAAIEEGIITQTTKERLTALEAQRDELQISIFEEETSHPKLTKEYVVQWLESFKQRDLRDPKVRRQVIECFVNTVYVFEDKIIVNLNLRDGDKPIALSKETGSDIETFGSPKSSTSQEVELFSFYYTW